MRRLRYIGKPNMHSEAQLADAQISQVISTLLGAMESLTPADPVARFRAMVTQPFAALLGSDASAAIVEQLLSRLATDPAGVPSYSITRQVGAMVFRRLAQLGLCAIGDARRAATMAGSARHRLIGCVEGTMRIARWIHSTDRDPSIIDRDCELTRIPDKILSRREFACFEAWRDVTEYEGSGVALILQSPLCHTTRWAYNRDTLKPVGLIAAERSLSRVEDALQMLRRVGSSQHASACDALLDHQSHVVRWEAIRTACALGHPASRELIERGTRDQHPDVREAAMTAMGMTTAGRQ